MVVVGAIVYGTTRTKHGAALSAQERTLLDQAASQAEAAGCAPVQTIPAYAGAPDQAHIGTQVASPPPLSSYPSTPPASGPHNPSPQGAGVYSSPPPVYSTIHSLEHGAAIVWYDPSALGQELERIKSFFDDVANSDHMIVAPYNYPDQGAAGRLPAGKQMVLVAWHHLQSCARPSLAAAFDFVAHYRFPPPAGESYKGDAPEQGAPKLMDRSEHPEESSSQGPPGDPRRQHPSAAAPPGGAPRRRSRWITVAAVIVGVGLLAALFGFGLGRDPSVIRSPLLGRRAPDFALRTLDGSRWVRLADLRGQVVVVNFWASWCAACREEHPALTAAWDRYSDQGVLLVGIDFQDRKGSALAFMPEMGGDWPVVEDPGGRTALDYGVYGVPETFFIGRDGVIRFKQIGPSSYEVLTHQIQALLDQGGQDR